MMHKTIKRVTEDIEANKFNTAVAGMMEWLNYLSRKDQISQDEYRTLLLLLAPFAPHISEELWEEIGQKYSIHQASWPVFDEKSLEEEEVPLIVQVNGKVRDVIMIQKDIISNKEVIEKMGKESVKVAKYLKGTSVKKIVYIERKVLNFIV